MMLLLCAVSFYVVLFRFCLLNVVYLICVVSIAVVLFSAFLFCYYYFFFLYLFVRFGKRGAKSLRGSVMAGLYRVAAAFVQGIQISDFTFILIL